MRKGVCEGVEGRRGRERGKEWREGGGRGEERMREEVTEDEGRGEREGGGSP